MKIRACKNTIVVRLPKTQERTVAAGLWIPPSAQEPPPEGIVVSIGPKAQEFCDQEGIRIGDRVLFEQYAGLEVTDINNLDVKLIMLEPHDIKAKFDD